MFLEVLLLLLLLLPGCKLIAEASATAATTTKVLVNTLAADDLSASVGGARSLAGPATAATEISHLTLCFRYRLKMLLPDSGRIVTIADWIESADDDGGGAFFNLFWYSLSPHGIFMGFGHPRAAGSYRSFLLEDEMGNSDLWMPNKWTSVCLAYDGTAGSVAMALVHIRRDRALPI